MLPAPLRVCRSLGIPFIARGAVLLAVLGPLVWASADASPRPGDLLVADASGQSVLIVNPVSGSQSVLTSGGLLSRPVAVAANTAGDVYVVNADRFGAGSKIVKVNPATGVQSLLSSGGTLLDPNDIVIEASGRLLVADYSGPSGLGGIFRINQLTGARSVVYAGGSTPFELAVEASGSVIFTTHNFFNSVLYRVDPGSGTATAINMDVGFADGVAVEASGNILVADSGAYPDVIPHVYRVDPISGARTTVTTGAPAGFYDIAVESDGDIYVLQPTAIVRVDPVTGSQVTVSTGGLFQGLSGLTFFNADITTPAAATTWGRIKAAYR